MGIIEERRDIKNAIKKFGTENFTVAALALLKSVGLESTKQMPLLENTFDGFISLFNPNNKPFNTEKAIVTDWRYIDFLFQITDDELKLDFSKEVVNSAADSYLFFCLELKGHEYTRTDLSQITREINKLFLIPALIIIKTGNKITLSIINRRQHRRDETKDVLEKVTLIKDICINNPLRAHIEILHDLSLPEIRKNLAKDKHDLKTITDLHNAWQKVLGTRELNKRFYKELSEWYYWAMGEVYFPDKRAQSVMQITKGNWKAYPEVRETNAQHLIRLLTRILFVWFIKEMDLVNSEFFEEASLARLLNDFEKDGADSNYYKAILQNLFFATLNQEITKRKFRIPGYKGRGIANQWRYESYFADKDRFIELSKKTPFLNGGLFECLDRIEYKTIDGKEREDKENSERIDWFSEEKGNELEVPNRIFFIESEYADLSQELGDKSGNTLVRGLFHILKDYKFTIAENTPIEEDVALDPELLGNVFENLLASYNPETKTTARKQTGSYYTPKEIVNYMVDESLKLYLKKALQDKTDMSESDIDEGLEILFAYTEKGHCFPPDETAVLIEAVDICKILDPACGSGAFPMGALHKLVYVLHKLDPDNKLWLKRQLKELSAISDPVQREDAKARVITSFEDNKLDYGRKLYLIRNCIYGVDIQPVATQISKLRFLISLMVDQKVDGSKPEENYRIQALPNLETKFVAANTLIGLPEQSGQLSWFNSAAVIEIQEEIGQVRSEMFAVRDVYKKRELRRKYKLLREKLKQELLIGSQNQQVAEKIAAWDPYDQNASSPFFDPNCMFGIGDGFDIVIGNPPYLESRNSAFDDKLKDELQAHLTSLYGSDNFVTRGADLLIYFFEVSLRFIKQRGINTFITQNSWLDTEYGVKFQKYVLSKTNIILILDSDSKYFETANINTVITIFEGTQGCNKRINMVRCHSDLILCSLPHIIRGSLPKELATMKSFAPNGKLLREKWGLLLNSDSVFFEILSKLNTAGEKVADIAGYSIGQGLNITKNYIVKRDELDMFDLSESQCIPYMTVDECNKFSWGYSNTFIVDGDIIGKDQKKKLKSAGREVFYNTSSRKRPVLILPRGIGSKHYCSYNQVNGYSASAVDVYCHTKSALSDDIIRIWLFLNSSICWLLREVSGRKNLGGGMLKAEAIDLKAFPIYFRFTDMNSIKECFESHRYVEALNVLDEVETERHKKIDNIVFSEMSLTKNEREYVINTLKQMYSQRSKKSQTL